MMDDLTDENYVCLLVIVNKSCSNTCKVVKY